MEELKKRIEAALAGRRPRVVEREGLVPAAVLILVTDRGGPHIVFTKRTERVAHHKGQISFPGGLVETRDGSRLQTALRECREEIGLVPEAVEVVGVLDDTETHSSGFVITPFVGLVRERPHWRPDGKEIERVLELPLAGLMDPASFRGAIWNRGDGPMSVYFYECQGEVIWGATARILKHFFDLLASVPDPDRP